MNSRLPFLAALALLIPTARAQTVEVIKAFAASGADGEFPVATLTVGPDGVLFGTTLEGGTNDDGTVFKITTQGQFTSLGSFDDATTGKSPYARLVPGGDGFLYGATERGTGTSGDPLGYVYRIGSNSAPEVVFPIPSSSADPAFPRALALGGDAALYVLGSAPAGIWRVPLNGDSRTVQYRSNSNTDGAFHYSLYRASNGLFYGTAAGISFVGGGENLRGTLWQVGPNGTGFNRLHECQTVTGTTPVGAMVEGPDGNLYGTMGAGGANGKGGIFRLTPGVLVYTLIHSFTSFEGAQGDLLLATDGFLYGTCRAGGDSGMGGIFRVSLNGDFKSIHAFTGTNGDGARPTGGLVQGPDGFLYGTTQEGGTGNRGTIFRVRIAVPPPNRAPVVFDDVAVTNGEVVDIAVAQNDFDPDDDMLTVSIATLPTAGSVEVLPDGTLRYAPGATFAGSDSFDYQLDDGRGGTAIATVTIQNSPPDPVVLAGVYNGLLYLDPAFAGSTELPRAQFALAVNALGRFTGSIVVRNTATPLQGAFGSDGIAVKRVKLPGYGKAVVFLVFSSDLPGGVAAFVIGKEAWTGSVLRVRASGAETKLRYTVLLSGDGDGLPAGVGYAVFAVKPTGLLRVVGKLGDGTPFASGTSLVGDGTSPLSIPVFAEPYRKGVIGGALAAGSPEDAFDYAGRLAWLRPKKLASASPYRLGFGGAAVAVASSYTAPESAAGILDFGVNQTGVVALGGGRLATEIVGGFSFATGGLVTQSPLRSLSFKKTTGLFSGRMRQGNAFLPFSGAVFQKGSLGGGLFLKGGLAGEVTLAPVTAE